MPSRFWTSYSFKFHGFWYVDGSTGEKIQQYVFVEVGKKLAVDQTVPNSSSVSVLQDSASLTDVSGPGPRQNLKERAAPQPCAFTRLFQATLSFNHHFRTTQFRNNRMCIADAVLASMQVQWNRMSVTDWAGTVFVEHVNRWSENSLTISLIKDTSPARNFTLEHPIESWREAGHLTGNVA